ncbi:MAG TPA: nitroreductase/quinone reductase family protein [Gaiellaceae bacterium]|nr:nitroreductase/quinone reductase family protein [Gaiellaceae bacterium]
MAGPPATTKGILIRRGLKSVGVLHGAVYRASGGRVGGRIWGLSILLLTTTGRKSGRLRTTPLCFLPDGGNLVVVASNGGLPWFPAWWLNLQAQPRATVRVGRARTAVVARPAAAEERARLWTAITTIAPGYLEYERRAPREIPLAILQPAEGSGNRGR